MIAVRRATPSDADSIASLWAADAGPTTLPGGAEEIRQLLAHDAAALLVAVEAGQVVGTLVVGWDGWRCNLYRLAVRPAARRRRIATRLMEAAAERASAIGARRLDALVSDTNSDAVAFWRAAGFAVYTGESRWTRPMNHRLDAS
jgi:ribosomal protein S18 acetylase RimI-like enzyme